MKTSRRNYFVVPITLLLVAVSITGCSQSRVSQEKEKTQKPAVKTAPAGEITDPGKKLFVDKGCQDCHKIEGTGGEIGPNLTGIGSSRDKAWLDSWLKSPTSVKRGASMPAPGLTDEERTLLVEFLSSQK